MLKTTLPAPRAQADALLALTDTLPSLSLDVAEHPQDDTAYLYTFFLPEAEKPALETALTALALTPGTYEPVPQDVDYVALTRANFPPLAIGPFYITRNGEAAAPGKTTIAIAPNRAFGSGEHATTTGCLLAYHALVREGLKFPRALDFGAGSGILAIAAAKTQGTHVTCVEIDAPSVDICEENAELNEVENLVVSLEGDTPPQGKEYDLVFANILLQPLLDLAEPLVGSMSENGTLILSGFTVDQAAQIEAKYEELGLSKVWQHEESGWLAQTWQF